MNNSTMWALCCVFLFYLFVIQPDLHRAAMTDSEKNHIEQQKQHSQELQAKYEQQVDAEIAALIKQPFNAIANQDKPTWLLYTALNSWFTGFVFGFVVVAGLFFFVTRF